MKLEKIFFIIVLTSVIFSSCRSKYPRGHDFSTISVGMNKNEVMEIKGSPMQVKAQGTTEYLIYPRNYETVDRGHLYFVRLINGTVEAFGRLGDFDSTKADHTFRIINEDKKD